MANNSVKIKLRAFRIENPTLTEPNSGIISLLKRVLTDSSTAQQRRMKLNEDDVDEDLLSYFAWQQNDSYLFGMMLRIIPAANGVINSDLFEHHTITIAEVNAGNPEQSQYKEHYYFTVSNDYLITNLSGSYSVDRLQTYINWLLNPVRDSKLFEFTPLTKVPDGIKLSEIKGIEFSGGGHKSTLNAGIVETENSTATKMQELTASLLDRLFSDTTGISDIERDQIITAKLLLTVKRKPQEMAVDDYQRVMGAVTRQITNDSGIAIITKNGNKYNGESVKVVRDIIVEKTTGNRLV